MLTVRSRYRPGLRWPSKSFISSKPRIHRWVYACHTGSVVPPDNLRHLRFALEFIVTGTGSCNTAAIFGQFPVIFPSPPGQPGSCQDKRTADRFRNSLPHREVAAPDRRRQTIDSGEQSKHRTVRFAGTEQSGTECFSTPQRGLPTPLEKNAGRRVPHEGFSTAC